MHIEEVIIKGEYHSNFLVREPTKWHPRNVDGQTIHKTIAGREMPQIHGNWALGDKFLQFCMMLHMGIGYSKTTANKVG